MDDALTRAGAAWDQDPGAGAWIEPLLGEWGPTVGASVPNAYAAHCVVALPEPHASSDMPPDRPAWLHLLDVLQQFTGDQPVHCGLWEGWGWLYDHGSDPATAPGMALLVAGGRPRWWHRGSRARAARAQAAQARARAAERLAEIRVERPAAAPLTFPARSYYLWTGPLSAAAALDDWYRDPPSLVWPDDRSWFVSIPEYTREAAVGGPAAVIDAVLASQRLDARPADRSTVLDIDD